MAIPAPLLARFESQLQALTFILARSTPRALDARPRPDEWSARENLAHLARHHAVFLDRMRREPVAAVSRLPINPPVAAVSRPPKR